MRYATWLLGGIVHDDDLFGAPSGAVTGRSHRVTRQSLDDSRGRVS